MAFPASQVTLSRALDSISSEALRIKAQAQSLRDASAAGAVQRQAVLDLQRLLHRAITLWQQNASTPGLADYARAQYANAQLDIVAEYVAMQNAAVALRDWIASNFPKDAASGAALVRTYDVSGTPIELTFTTAELAQLRTRVDAFVATIA